MSRSKSKSTESVTVAASPTATESRSEPPKKYGFGTSPIIIPVRNEKDLDTIDHLVLTPIPKEYDVPSSSASKKKKSGQPSSPKLTEQHKKFIKTLVTCKPEIKHATIRDKL